MRIKFPWAEGSHVCAEHLAMARDLMAGIGRGDELELEPVDADPAPVTPRDNPPDRTEPDPITRCAEALERIEAVLVRFAAIVDRIEATIDAASNPQTPVAPAPPPG